MFKKIKEKAAKILEQPPLIHPEFKIRFKVQDDDGKIFYWFQNREVIPGHFPSLKIAFPVDDPAILDECPFMAKIGNNTNPENHKYFALVYGGKDELRAMEEWIWSKDIQNAKLLTESGEFIEDVPEKS
jgi:hypothetical protein